MNPYACRTRAAPLKQTARAGNGSRAAAARLAASVLIAAAFLRLDPCPARAAGAPGDLLLVRAGFPDLIVAAGDTLDPGAGAEAVRWTGLWLTRVRLAPGREAGAVVVTGRCLRLDLAVGPGAFEFEVDLVGVGNGSGPADILAGDALVAQVPALAPGERAARAARVETRDAALSLFLKPEPGSQVAVAEARIRPLPLGAPLRIASPAAVPAPVPDPAACLRAACDHLVAVELPTGLFDYEAGSWWEMSYAVRALLLGYRILGEARYRDAARRAMDSFVAEQNQDGGWCAARLDAGPRGVRGAGLRSSFDCGTRNLADLGTITTCLSLLAAVLPESAGAAYVRAHRDYIDGYASLNETAEGGYANGLYLSDRRTAPYSVATATQAMSLAALYRATGEKRHLARAERAARFLLAGWQADGRPLFHPHDDPVPVALDAMRFGDAYYILEGLLWVHAATADPSLAAAIRRALRAYLYGPRGFLAGLGAAPWVPPSNAWRDACKGNAMLAVLIEAKRILTPDQRLDRAITAGAAALCVDPRRSDYAVLDPPCLPQGRKGTICTCFAALSFASCVRPGSAFGAGE